MAKAASSTAANEAKSSLRQKTSFTTLGAGRRVCAGDRKREYTPSVYDTHCAVSGQNDVDVDNTTFLAPRELLKLK